MTTTQTTHPLDRQGNDQNRVTMRDVKHDVTQLKQDVTECVTDAAHTGIEAATAGATKAIDAGKKAADVAKDAHVKMCEYVAEHPTTAVLIAAGVGALLARVLPRR